MEGNKAEKPKGVFTREFHKFEGREVSVYIYSSDGTIEVIEGLCEALDMYYKAVIIRTKTETLFIPRYKYIKRARKNPETT